MKLRNKLLIFFASFFFFSIFLPSGHMPSDSLYSLATAQSICTGKISIIPTEKLPYLSEGINGKYYSKYGLAYALLFVPSALIANIVSKYTTIDAFQLHQILASSTNTFIAALCIIVLMSIMSKFGTDKKTILITSVLTASCSLLLPYSKINHSELPVAFLLLLFAKEWYDCEKLAFKKGVYFGSIMSILLLLKIGNVISSIIIAGGCLYCIIIRKYTKSGVLAAFVPPITTTIFLFFLNMYRYGTFFNFGYGTEQQEFTTPITAGLLAFLISPSKSIVLFSPLLILSLTVFLKVFTQNKRFHITIIIILFSNVLFYSCWHDWHGGWSWGPRLIAPVVILMHIYLPFFFKWFRFQYKTLSQMIKSSIIAALICFSLFINVLGSLIWYQQIYYFHRDYFSLNYSHPIIAFKLFSHKLKKHPEKYACSTFNRDCRQPPYTTIWDSITQNDTIDFQSFETFQGYSTFWGYLRAKSGSSIYYVFPVILSGLSLLFMFIYHFINRDYATVSQEKTILQ